MLGAVPAAAVLAVAPVVSSPDLAGLFAQWMAVQQEPFDDLIDFQDTDRHERYAELQAAICAVVPVTARDLAMQFYAATDAGGSECPDEFMDRLRSLIGG
jgi:hypothetical protein